MSTISNLKHQSQFAEEEEGQRGHLTRINASNEFTLKTELQLQVSEVVNQRTTTLLIHDQSLLSFLRQLKKSVKVNLKTLNLLWSTATQAKET